MYSGLFPSIILRFSVRFQVTSVQGQNHHLPGLTKRSMMVHGTAGSCIIASGRNSCKSFWKGTCEVCKAAKSCFCTCPGRVSYRFGRVG